MYANLIDNSGRARRRWRRASSWRMAWQRDAMRRGAIICIEIDGYALQYYPRLVCAVCEWVCEKVVPCHTFVGVVKLDSYILSYFATAVYLFYSTYIPRVVWRAEPTSQLLALNKIMRKICRARNDCVAFTRGCSRTHKIDTAS